MSLREEMWKYEQITGESAEHVPIIKLGAFLDGYEMAIKTLEQQPCDDYISREEVLKVMCDNCPMYNCVCGCSSYRHIERMASVTPSIPDVKNDFNIGYNCGYADAMFDIAEGE